jgi:hypothetical protein
MGLANTFQVQNSDFMQLSFLLFEFGQYIDAPFSCVKPKAKVCFTPQVHEILNY